MHVSASEMKRSVCAICRRFGISRAAFYKATKARSRKEINEELILALVRPSKIRLSYRHQTSSRTKKSRRQTKHFARISHTSIPRRVSSICRW